MGDGTDADVVGDATDEAVCDVGGPEDVLQLRAAQFLVVKECRVRVDVRVEALVDLHGIGWHLP